MSTNSNTVLKMSILKFIAYLLIIVSFVMFGKSWLTFESSRTRRDITEEIEEMLSYMQNISQSELDELNDQLADYDLDITGEELIDKEYDALSVLKDAEISPKEAMIFVTRAAWLVDHADKIVEGYTTLDVKNSLSKVKTYGVIIQFLYYATILAFVGSIFAMIASATIGTYCYSIMTIIQFVLFAVFKSRVNTFLSSALNNLGVSFAGNNLAMRFCYPAFVSLICAVAASIVWSVLLYTSVKAKIAVPGVLSLIRKSSKTNEEKKVLPKSKVCSCGAIIGQNDKFCPSCGKPVSKKVQNICRNCKAVLDPDSLFCPECGTKVENAMEGENEKISAPIVYKCWFCGEELESNVLYCSRCGKKQIDNNNEETDRL